MVSIHVMLLVSVMIIKVERLCYDDDINLLSESFLKENPAIRDRLKMILRNPRLLDLMSIIIFSTAFFLYVFDYWVITNHDNDYDD